MSAILLLLGFAPVALSQAGAPHWVATWGTAQQLLRLQGGGRGAGGRGPQGPAAQNPSPPVPAAAPGRGPQRRFGIPPALSGVTNQTVRMIVRTSIGGQTVRVRLSSALGGTSVALGAARIAIRAAGSAIVPGSDRVLTFSGKPAATLYAGELLVSDPVNLNVTPLSDVAISLYFPGETGPPTSHTFGLRPTYISKEGDFTAAPEIADPAGTTQSYYWLAGIDVLAPAQSAAIVTFGDSITDGDQSTPDTNGMWPAVLAARLQANKATAHIAVVNAGISGNRILGDNNGGVVRLLHDALSVPGVKWITLLEGINDITGATRSAQQGTSFGADNLIAAYRQVIETAHLYDVKVIGCTITPFGESNVFTDRGEAIREAVNDWTRTSGAFDGVVDFDAATRDPQDPKRFRPEADSPDMLHPGDAGYKLMAAAIDLSMFGTKAAAKPKKKKQAR